MAFDLVCPIVAASASALLHKASFKERHRLLQVTNTGQRQCKGSAAPVELWAKGAVPAKSSTSAHLSMPDQVKTSQSTTTGLSQQPGLNSWLPKGPHLHSNTKFVFLNLFSSCPARTSATFGFIKYDRWLLLLCHFATCPCLVGRLSDSLQL